MGACREPAHPQQGTTFLSGACEKQELMFSTFRTWRTIPAGAASQPSREALQSPESCGVNPAIPALTLAVAGRQTPFSSQAGLISSPAELAGRILHVGTGTCRRTERWERPRQSSANSPDKIVPQIPKAGLGLSNLAPKTAPAYIPRAGAAALIPRNRELCSRICHSDLQGGSGSTRERGAGGVWGGPSPGGCTLLVPQLSQTPEKLSRAGCGPARLRSAGKESLVYLI